MLTLVPPALLLAFNQPLLAFLLLVLLHAPVVWGTLHPHSTLFGPVLTQLPTDRAEVWLTVDDGPSADTLGLLDLLDQHEAKATFFLVGAKAVARPDLVRAIASRGHGIGNHSASHPAGRFWRLSPGQMRTEIGDAQRVLTELSGERPRWFRAVVGHANPFVAPVLEEMNLARVSWSARGYDGLSGSVERVVARVVKGLRPGAIVLLHEGAGHGKSLVIAARILAALKQRGLRAVLPSAPAADEQPVVERRVAPER